MPDDTDANRSGPPAPLVQPFDPDITVLHEFDSIHEWHVNDAHCKLTARIIERHGKRFLDLREYQTTDHHEGYTRRGLRLTIHEVDRIASSIFPRAIEMLRSRPSHSKPHER